MTPVFMLQTKTYGPCTLQKLREVLRRLKDDRDKIKVCYSSCLYALSYYVHFVHTIPAANIFCLLLSAALHASKKRLHPSIG